MKMRKWLSLALAAFMSLGFCACDPAGLNDEEGGDPNDTRTRLRVSVYKAGFGIDWLNAIAAEYEKENPTVKVVVKGDKDMEGTAQTYLETGKVGDAGLSDIYSCISDANYYKNVKYDKNGDGVSDRLVCLDDFYNEEIENGKNLHDIMDPNFDRVVNVDGHYYGMPWNAAVTGIMYNVNMFRTNNWQVPKTMTEFTTLCNQIKSKGIAPIGYCGGAADGYLYDLFAGYWAQIGGAEDVNEFYNFASADVYKQESRKQAYEAIGTIFGNSDWMLTGASGMSNIEAQQAFIKGECAMVIGGSWFKTEMSAFLEEYPNFECAMMPTPWVNEEQMNVEGAKNGNLSDATMLVVAQTSQNKELALDFLKFMNTTDMIKLYTQKTKGNPRPLTYEGIDLTGLDVWGQSLMNTYLNATNVYPVSYKEQYRIGNLKNILASNGTICDDFSQCRTLADGLAMAESIWESDYSIASLYFN